MNTVNQNCKILDSEVEQKSAELGVTMGVATDLPLRIGDRQFQAHRSVLSLHSPVVKALISEQWSESNNDTFQISDEHIDVDVMDELLTFLYTGRITLTANNTHPLCMAANYLDISTLLDHTVKHLYQLLTPENVLQFIEFSSTVHLETLLNSCFVFIKANHAQAFQHSRFLELPPKDFKDLIVGLKEHVWGTNLRKETFRFIIRWAEMNLTERSNDLPALLKSIPLEELPLDFVTGTVSTHPLVKDSPSCMETVTAGIENHQAHSETVSKTQQNFIVFDSKSERQASRRIIGCYDCQTHVLTELPAMVDGRTCFACTSIHGKRFVVAGGKIDGRPTASVSMFDWNTQTWSELPRMPYAQYGCSMVFLDGKLYVAGGHINGRPTNAVSMFDWTTQTWSESPRTPHARNRFLMVFRDGTLSVAGGWTGSDPSTKTVHYYSFATQLVEHKGFLYVIGGWGENTVERYDPLKNERTQLTSMHNKPNMFVAAVHADKIYVWSEYSLEVFDPETNVWTVLGEPNIDGPTPLLSMNGQLVTVGAVALGVPDAPKQVWRLDTSTNQWIALFEVDPDIDYCCCPGLVGAFH